MSEMKNIPGTPDWIKAGGKSTNETPAQKPVVEEKTENKEITE